MNLLLLFLALGVFGLFRPAELHLRPAGGDVLVVEAGGENILLEGAQSARLRLVGDAVECQARGRVWTATSVHAWSHFLLSVPGKISRRFHGTLEVSAGRGMLVAVVTVDRETAVAAAVAAESPPGASLEALKAQAIVTRSYYAAARGRHAVFDFCDTTHCQFLREPPAPQDPAFRAATETRGLLLAYRGAPLAALFSASCGGRTRSLGQAEGYPYFPVECAYCRRHARRWETRLDAKQASALLAEETSEGLRLQIGRKLGWSAIPGGNYRARLEGEEVVVRGRGAGHGVGLCQQGAAAMAAAGARFREILQHYYPNTALIDEEP